MAKIIYLYLSGPMYLGKDQATKWRDEVKSGIGEWESRKWRRRAEESKQFGTDFEFLRRNDAVFNILDPCDRWYEKGLALTNVGGYVVQMDKLEIAKSHIVLVNATDPGWGTPMEQYIAYTANKMVIAFSECEFPSIWAIEHSHQMFKTHIQATEFICAIADNIKRVV